MPEFRLAVTYVSVLALVSFSGCGANPESPDAINGLAEMIETSENHNTDSEPTLTPINLGGIPGGFGGTPRGNSTIENELVFLLSPRIAEAPAEVHAKFDESSAQSATVNSEWDFGNGWSASGTSAVHTYEDPGEYEVQLRVVTADGREYVSRDIVEIIPDYEIQALPGDDPFEVTFKAVTKTVGSAWPNGGRFEWDFGDGGTTEGPEVVHQYAGAGTYAVALTFVTALSSIQCAQRSLNVTTDGNDPTIDEALVVTPTDDYATSGDPGGPFTPADKNYTITNNASKAVTWSATVSVDWVNVSPPTGTLAAGESVTINVAVNDAADVMGRGVYDGELIIRNLVKDTTAATRAVTLAVAALPPDIDALSNDSTDAGSNYTRWPALSQGTAPVTWSLIDAPAGMTIDASSGGVTWSNPQPANSTHTIIVRADNVVGWDEETWTLTVVGNAAPHANAGVDRMIADSDGDGSAAVLLYASASSDTDGTIVNYRWMNGSTVLYDGPDHSVTVSLPLGVHTIELTVTDDGGETDVDQVVITVDSQRASSISQDGITWIFDKAYPVGQFINGDWWVRPESPGGDVVVVAVDPPPTTIDWRGSPAQVHGSMVNPIFNESPYSNRQAFDSRAQNYCEVGDTPGDTGHVYTVTYPVTLNGPAVLISTESWLTDESHEDLLGVNPIAEHAYLKKSAILTCLDTAPSPTAFRPAYMDPAKTIYDYADVDLNKLPKLTPPNDLLRFPPDVAVSGNPAEQPCTVYAQYFERPWMLGWKYDVHPTEQQSWYYEPCQVVAADAAALLLCDYPDREALLIPYLQFCLDAYYATQGDADFQAEQRGDRSLMKWPCLFAGELFGVPAMKAVAYQFKTDADTYYRSECTSPITSATIPADEFWVITRGHWTPPPGVDPVGWRGTPGDQEHEHLDPLTTLTMTSVYYDGTAADARIEASDDSHSLFLRTYNSGGTLLSEVRLNWRATADEQASGWIRIDEYDTVVEEINAQPGWHAAATAYPDAEGPFFRGPLNETSCKGSGNAVDVTCNEWDIVPALGGRKKETYRGINSYPWPGFALAAREMGLMSTWGHSAFFDYVDRWMTEDGAGESADLESVGYSPLADSKLPGEASSDFVEALWANYR